MLDRDIVNMENTDPGVEPESHQLDQDTVRCITAQQPHTLHPSK